MSEWERALAQHQVYQSSFDPLFWQGYLREHPDVLHHIMADLYEVAGVKRGSPTLDDLWQLVAPRYSEKPFGLAFKDALGGRSIRQIAGVMHMYHTTVARYVNGQRPVVLLHDPVGSMLRIEVFAKALGVPPAYFIEWRRLWVVSLIDSALELHPSVSTSIYRKFSDPDARSIRHVRRKEQSA